MSIEPIDEDIAPKGSKHWRTEERRYGDAIYRAYITACAIVIPLLLIGLTVVITRAAWPAVNRIGLKLVFGTVWDVAHNEFGAFPALAGTIASSFIALVIATPLAISAGILAAELAPVWLRTSVAVVVDLLAAIPSVVYGLWGVSFIVPFVRDYIIPISRDRLHLGSLTLFAGPAYGPSLLSASLVLAIMILPYIASVSREVLLAVPNSQREAALALGATRWEMIRDAVIPFARSGLVGGVMLGLGRALGETMAVTMVIGNSNVVPRSFFDPASTIASLLANEFGEASSGLHLSALMAVAGVLLMVALLINAMARWLVWRVGRNGVVSR